MAENNSTGINSNGFDVVGGLASLVNTGISAWQGSKDREQSQKNLQMEMAFNQNEAKKERDYNLEMWNLSNTYNSPQEQMARLKAAGLNPNMVYGTGNVSGLSSSSAPSMKRANTPNFSNVLPQQVAPIGNVLNAYQDYRMKDEAINSTSWNNWYKNLESHWAASNQVSKAGILESKESIGRSKAAQEHALAKLAPELAKSSLDTKKANIEKLRSSTRSLDLDNDLNALLKPYGITTRDNALLRQIVRVMAKENPNFGATDIMLLLPLIMPALGNSAAGLKTLGR